MKFRNSIAVALTALTALTMTACKGAEGPAGPEGPMGPRGSVGPSGQQGLPGPAGATGQTRFNCGGPATGTVTECLLPLAAGTNPQAPPSVAGYTSSGANGPWLAVNDGFSSTTPWVAVSFSATAGRWLVSMHNTTAGWYVAFVVVY